MILQKLILQKVRNEKFNKLSNAIINMPLVDVGMLLAKVREKMKEPDIVVDPYDLTFVWVSKNYCKLTGYSEDELIDKQLFFTSTQDKNKLREMELELLSEKVGDKKEIPIKTKSGKILIARVEDVIVNFEDHPYMAGRLLELVNK